MPQAAITVVIDEVENFDDKEEVTMPQAAITVVILVN